MSDGRTRDTGGVRRPRFPRAADSASRAGRSLEHWLFATERDLIRDALAAGIHTFVIDWESRGKTRRQRNADTEINRHTAQTLKRVASMSGTDVICRINGADAEGTVSAREVELAIDNGAAGILLPMVRSVAEVERFLSIVDGRVQAGILVETDDACRCAVELARLPLDVVYVGLNDLSISRSYPSLFEALVDGTIDVLREVFRSMRFGYGGVTVVDGGHPIPCRLLLADMARLGCDFSFLRRSFRRDLRSRDLHVEIQRLAIVWQKLRSRDPAEMERDRGSLVDAIRRAGPQRHWERAPGAVEPVHGPV